MDRPALIPKKLISAADAFGGSALTRYDWIIVNVPLIRAKTVSLFYASSPRNGFCAQPWYDVTMSGGSEDSL